MSFGLPRAAAARLSRSQAWLGPPHPVSKIRPFVPDRRRFKDAHWAEYDRRRWALQWWNHRFWRAHNELFEKEKAAYIRSLGPAAAPPADAQMAGFYSRFLRSRSEQLADYNRKWYRGQLGLLLHAFKLTARQWSSYMRHFLSK